MSREAGTASPCIFPAGRRTAGPGASLTGLDRGGSIIAYAPGWIKIVVSEVTSLPWEDLAFFHFTAHSPAPTLRESSYKRTDGFQNDRRQG